MDFLRSHLLWMHLLSVSHFQSFSFVVDTFISHREWWWNDYNNTDNNNNYRLMRLFTKYPQPKMLKRRLFFKTIHLTFLVLWSLLLHQQHHIVDDDDSVKSLGCVPTQCCCHWMLLVDNLMGLILLVLSSSFTVTVCTVRDYHRVEFLAMISY